jgi:hypothetical protein
MLPDKLYEIFMPVFRVLFIKSGEDGDVLGEGFPDEWRVTIETLDSPDKMAWVSASVYRRWVWDIQRYANEINERAVQETTEEIFPNIEPMLFARYVKLWVNMGLIQTGNTKGLQEAIARWHIFGHVGRTSMAEWVPTLADEQAFEQRYFQQLHEDEQHTIDLLKKLGWFPKERTKLQELAEKLKNVVNNGDWQLNTKTSWVNFADQLMLLADDGTV